MSKPKLIVYSQELSNCPCFQDIFNTEFNAEPADTSNHFLRKIKNFNPVAAVVCFCSAWEKDAEELLRLDALSGPLLVLTCSKTLTPDFVCAAAEIGAKRFLCCEWERTKIETVILEVIRHGGMKEFLEAGYPGSLSASPHFAKIAKAIVLTFPKRLHENELAQKLEISPRWLRTICRKSFGKTFTQLMRQIWVQQALRLMKHTMLDNWEIAMQLNYSEESNLARDFRKQLGYSPNEARRRLARTSPEELLCK